MPAFIRASFVLAVSMSLGALCAPVSAAEFLGNDSCADCHATELQAWQGSHHDLAMQPASADTVLGDFNDARFTYGGVTSRFFREGGQYWVETDNAQGDLERFKVAYVFGVYPLQQLLLPLPGGRLQALSIAWDARPATQGGQRWYHIYADEPEPILAGDPLHWSGPYHNWNARCAECHSTNVRKNYDATTRGYDTVYDQIDVGCEACHGPGSRHVEHARNNSLDKVAHAGFALTLAARGQWVWPEGASIAQRHTALDSQQQIDNCGRCHARRSTLGDYHYGADLLDTHRLATLDSQLYFPDGQIRDEVYVYGSFIQSKMHRSGVVCSNCHNPHSNELLAEGNGLCSQCHKAAQYDDPTHHFHPVESNGAQCVNCHMPARRYMGVDWRRDHSMRIPRPDLTLTTGSPNACNGCHKEQSASWALDILKQRGVTFSDQRSHPARALHGAQQGDIRSLPALKKIVDDGDASAMLRGSALQHYGQFAPPDLAQTAAMLLSAKDPLLRASAVRSTASLPPRQRYLMLRTLISDPVLGVRMAVAEQLADMPRNELRAKDLPPLDALLTEYLSVQEQHRDMPSVLVQIAHVQVGQGAFDRAEETLREALRINPQFQAARINLADLLRQNGREQDARTLLQEGISEGATPGVLEHALGLLEIRTGHIERALDYLKRAADSETEGTRHRYVYAVALHDTGKPAEALALLERLNVERPGNPELLYALVGFARELGDAAKAGRYQAQLQGVAQAAGLR